LVEGVNLINKNAEVGGRICPSKWITSIRDEAVTEENVEYNTGEREEVIGEDGDGGAVGTFSLDEIMALEGKMGG
jgi:hypothetical protein